MQLTAVYRKVPEGYVASEESMKAQQEKIENLTERVIRLETALEIALARSSVARSTARLVERKD